MSSPEPKEHIEILREEIEAWKDRRLQTIELLHRIDRELHYLYRRKKRLDLLSPTNPTGDRNDSL